MTPSLWRTWAAAALLLAAAGASLPDHGDVVEEDSPGKHLLDELPDTIVPANVKVTVDDASHPDHDDVDEEVSPGRRLLGQVVDAMVPVDELGADNELWRGLKGACSRRPGYSCVGEGVFGYLERSLAAHADLRLSDGIVFARNAALENKYARALNVNATEDEGRQEDEVSGRSLGTFHEVADALYERGARFAMTHDVRLQLPEVLFGGAELRISPRSLNDDGGALLEVEVYPARDDDAQGRIFFKKHNFKKKLMMSFMALLLVIKMIKVKLIYLLPLLIGVGAAKKLLLKALLFIFPAFAHLFKFCSTYHASYSGKYHHHHHQIAHHHHHVKVPVPVPVPVPAHSHTIAHTAEEGYPASSYGGGGNSWEPPSAPGHDYAGSRSEFMVAAHQTEKELASWGLGHANGDPTDTFSANYGDPASAHALAYGSYSPVSGTGVGAAGEVRPARNSPPGGRPVTVYATPVPPAPQRKTQLAHNLHHQVQGLELQQQLQRQNKVQQKLQHLRVPQSAALSAPPPVAVAYDSFYSPVLQRMDNVFVQLGFNEEACRERLVCSMYKSPARFSPHSNLISAELSRDPSELQKPSSPNSAVVRFYRYVQAARDGQEQKNCLSLYPACTVNTDLWRQ